MPKSEVYDSIAGNWEDFSGRCIPPDASPNQVRQTRRAFYAGSMTMFGTMTRISDDRPEDEAMMAMESLWREIQAFNMLLQAGLA